MNPLTSINKVEISDYPIASVAHTLCGQDESGKKFCVLKLTETKQGDQLVPNISALAKQSWWSTTPFLYMFEECNRVTIRDSKHFKSILDRNIVVIFTYEGEMIYFNGFPHTPNNKTKSTLTNSFIDPDDLATDRKDKNDLATENRKKIKLDHKTSEAVKTALLQYASLFNEKTLHAPHLMSHRSRRQDDVRSEGNSEIVLGKPINAPYRTQKMTLNPNPPLPLDKTEFKSLEDFKGNNVNKDPDYPHVAGLLDQCIHFAKHKGYSNDIKITTSFDCPEERNLLKTNSFTNKSGALLHELKFNFYIEAKNIKGESIKLILERMGYCSFDFSLQTALGEFTKFADNQKNMSLDRVLWI